MHLSNTINVYFTSDPHCTSVSVCVCERERERDGLYFSLFLSFIGFRPFDLWVAASPSAAEGTEALPLTTVLAAWPGPSIYRKYRRLAADTHEFRANRSSPPTEGGQPPRARPAHVPQRLGRVSSTYAVIAAACGSTALAAWPGIPSPPRSVIGWVSSTAPGSLRRLLRPRPLR